MKTIYQINDRVEYWVRIKGTRTHRVGFIKMRKVGLFRDVYYICHASGTHEVDKVRASHIFGQITKQTNNKSC